MYDTKDLDIFRRLQSKLKRQKLGLTGNFQQQGQAVVQASYEIAFEIAKNKKTHTVA